MQSWYAASFEREMGCTEREWLSWLPGAVRDCRLSLRSAGAGASSGAGAGSGADVEIDGGCLRLNWQVLPPRQIALLRMPRLALQFRFEGVADAPRQRFMRYFDLYMQRGGG